MQKIDNEVWKDIPAYEGKYQVSDLGRVRSLNYRGNTGKTKALSPGINRGYYRVSLYEDGKVKSFSVHSLVYTSFNGPIPPGMTVDHVNGIKTDNRPENLQLLTRGDNARKSCLGGNPWNKGKKLKPLSAAHRAKLSAAAKAYYERKRSGINTL